MQTLPIDLVGDAYCSTHHWDVLCDLIDLDRRMAGQEGERKAACLIADDLESNGVRDVSTTKFEISGWWRGLSSLTAAYTGREHRFDADHEVIALPGTPQCDITAELVGVGYGRNAMQGSGESPYGV